jgi:hypothetical protein
MLTGVLDDAKEKIAVMDVAEKGKREMCSLQYLATVDGFGSNRELCFSFFLLASGAVIATAAAVDPQELVDYSAFISYTVAPPPNWRDGVYLGPFRYVRHHYCSCHREQTKSCYVHEAKR